MDFCLLTKMLLICVFKASVKFYRAPCRHLLKTMKLVALEGYD